MKIKDINQHPLLTESDRLVIKAMLKHSKKEKREFAMLDHARYALRAAGVDYANAGTSVTAIGDLERAAILFVYEALKACDIAIIKEWPEFDEMLRSLEYLAGDMP